MKLLLLASLRGNIFLYQGEELGLTQVDIAFEDLLDPEAIANWPMTLSRDGARTPLPWIGSAPDQGFRQRNTVASVRQRSCSAGDRRTGT